MILIDMNGNRYEVTRVMARNMDPASERWYRKFDVPDDVFFRNNARVLVDELRKSGGLAESKHTDKQGDVIYQSEVYVLTAVEKEEEELP